MGGKRVTVVALHGNGGGLSSFAPVREHMAADVRFRAVTLPGFGLRPRDKRLDGPAGYAGRLREQLVGEAPPLVLLGHGVGACIVLELLQRHPATVSGAILHAPGGAPRDERIGRRLLRLPGAAPLTRWAISGHLTRPVARRALVADWRRDRAGPGEGAGEREWAGMAGRADRLLDGYRHCAVFGQMLDIADADWFSGLRPVDLPAVLLRGERERSPCADAVDDYLRLLRRGRVRTVPGWGRFPMVAHPAGYAAEVADLARGLVGATV
ncbi:MAG: alpha/beta hydrolase [Actinobacteria bacterium]|nr:alpha/beta hydrolase [Actinomycetota bacterium]